MCLTHLWSFVGCGLFLSILLGNVACYGLEDVDEGCEVHGGHCFRYCEEVGDEESEGRAIMKRLCVASLVGILDSSKIKLTWHYIDVCCDVFK
jgi:hypothetical protein